MASAHGPVAALGAISRLLPSMEAARSYDRSGMREERGYYAFVEREIPILIDRYRTEREQGKEDPGS